MHFDTSAHICSKRHLKIFKIWQKKKIAFLSQYYLTYALLVLSFNEICRTFSEKFPKSSAAYFSYMGGERVRGNSQDNEKWTLIYNTFKGKYLFLESL